MAMNCPDVRAAAAPFPSTRTEDDFEDSPNVYGDGEEMSKDSSMKKIHEENDLEVWRASSGAYEIYNDDRLVAVRRRKKDALAYVAASGRKD